LFGYFSAILGQNEAIFFHKFETEHVKPAFAMRKIKFLQIREVLSPQKKLDPQITSPQILKQDWVRKPQICKLHHLRKVRKSNKFIKSENLQICETFLPPSLLGI
jgi:hypothetical protein